MSSPKLFSQKTMEKNVNMGVPKEYLDGLQANFENAMKDKNNYTVYQPRPHGYAHVDVGYPETFTEYKKNFEEMNNNKE